MEQKWFIWRGCGWSCSLQHHWKFWKLAKYLLSILGSKYSLNDGDEARKKALLGKMAMNDEAERALGRTTANIQRYGGWINTSSAGAISDTRRNEFVHWQYVPAQKKSATKVQGVFHGLSDVIQETIVLVSKKDAPSTRKKNNNAIQLQKTAQQIKVELWRRKIWNVQWNCS